MSVGYELLILGMVIHGIMAFGVGFMWSLIPKKVIGLSGFVLFYIAIAIWYTATFDFQMLIYSTLYPFYVIVGLVGFVLQERMVHWLVKKGYYKKRMKEQEENVKP
jgi:hypothetical protein